ncbi:hypothetical protein [Actinocrispum wychmicini]|nr:hypothetical protein [Actinocrispum wychmicini]
MDDLVGLESFDAALELMRTQGVDVVDITDVQDLLGDGFLFLQKDALVNIPMMLLDVKHTWSPSYDAPMVTVRAMTATHKRVKFVDFGTGIRSQLEMFEARAGRSPIGMVIPGLEASQYDVCNDCGRANCQDHADATVTRATTYRLKIGA